MLKILRGASRRAPRPGAREDSEEMSEPGNEARKSMCYEVTALLCGLWNEATPTCRVRFILATEFGTELLKG